MELNQIGEEKKTEDPFSSEAEIKILENRLRLLRDGLKPLSPDAEPTSQVEENKETEFVPVAEVHETPVAPPPAAQQVMNVATDTPPVLPPLPDVDVLKEYSKDKQINALVEVALSHNLYEAVEIARKLNNPYLLDAFHDLLSDDDGLRLRMQEQGKMEKM
jgi:hypothetical protein